MSCLPELEPLVGPPCGLRAAVAEVWPDEEGGQTTSPVQLVIITFINDGIPNRVHIGNGNVELRDRISSVADYK